MKPLSEPSKAEIIETLKDIIRTLEFSFKHPIGPHKGCITNNNINREILHLRHAIKRVKEHARDGGVARG